MSSRLWFDLTGLTFTKEFREFSLGYKVNDDFMKSSIMTKKQENIGVQALNFMAR